MRRIWYSKLMKRDGMDRVQNWHLGVDSLIFIGIQWHPVIVIRRVTRVFVL